MQAIHSKQSRVKDQKSCFQLDRVGASLVYCFEKTVLMKTIARIVQTHQNEDDARDTISQRFGCLNNLISSEIQHIGKQLLLIGATLICNDTDIYEAIDDSTNISTSKSVDRSTQILGPLEDVISSDLQLTGKNIRV